MEKDFIILCSLVAIGVVIASGLALILQSTVVLPVIIFGIIMFLLILLQDKKRFVEITESLETKVFIITLIIIIIGIIIMYKPI